MTASQIRQSFIDFFKEKQHTAASSASLMPRVPNLLFTNAGMNQFVPYFLGDRPAPHPRIVDTQKCIRAGGKHNDLEDVGFDTYHHTFFEMLGNWSFGDYFKKDAIEWSWELLTKVWKFPKDRLYATVYKPGNGDPAEFDQEAYDLWKAIFEKEGLTPAVHIVYGNQKDNFWMMGDTGPCGPCSEIHMDLTEKGDTQGKLVNCDSAYCIEIWNLVFMQFNAEPDGSFKPLAAQHVDTGMGLERVAGIITTTKNFTDYSQVPSNYSSDLFTHIFDKITQLCGVPYNATLGETRDNMSEQELQDCSFRVIADHIRTLAFAIADGILPGNVGRNYVLRRILRRAILFSKHLGLKHGFLVELAESVVSKVGGFFNELKENKSVIHKVILNEEKAFDRTIDRGLQLLDKITEVKSEISGEDAFTLYDTYGFPIDLTQLIARERHLSVDLAGFNKAMEAQRERTRAAQKKTVITVSRGEEESKTEFVGYDFNNLTQVDAKVLDVVESEGKHFMTFDVTPFYAEMGGQVGDTGLVEIEGNQYNVANTLKDGSGNVFHEIESAVSADLAGKTACLSVDKQRRHAIQRHHTATHIIHWALRKVLGSNVQQAGSLVTLDFLRFDFSHFEAVNPEQIQEIEQLVNDAILQNDTVTWNEVPFDEKPDACLAFFDYKYDALVRVVDVGGYSMELCGGTHVRATGEIGACKVVSESAIAAGTRRIEVVAGASALKLMQDSFNQLHHFANTLSCKPEEIEFRLNALVEQRSSLEKELRKHQQKGAAVQADNLVNQAQNIDGLKWIVAKVNVENPNDMRGLAIQLFKKVGEGAIVLGGAFGDKVTVMALCSESAIKAGHQARSIVKEITAQLDGKGGGKPDFAMGGANNPEKLECVLNAYELALAK